VTSSAGDGGAAGRSSRRDGGDAAGKRTRRRSNQEIGAAGEDQAARWYLRHGYKIVARNWRCREGELDLVLVKRRLLVISEVKSRSSLAFGAPIEAITPVKAQRLRVVASRFIEETGARPSNVRFDVVCILAGKLDVVEGAF
jgi:putative endonuclease